MTPMLIDLDATFLPVAEMRQISRVTALEGAGIEGAGQLIALWAWAQGQRGRPRLVRTSAEFHKPVGQWAASLLLKAEVRRKRHLNFGSVQIFSEGTLTATVEAVLVVLAPG